MLRGEALADAYASMDLLLFPSHTDTFGNVVLEAQASGVPVLVTASGGPKFLVEHGSTGWIAHDDRGFVRLAVAACRDASTLGPMGVQARSGVLGRAWSNVFADLYSGYATALVSTGASPRTAAMSTI